MQDVSRLEDKGNKAYRLAQMRAAGMPVPDGVLLTPDFMSRMAAAPVETRERELDWIWRRLGGVQLAVRSSGSGEDGANHSFAGVFESVIDVDRAGLEAAIARVQASFEAARVSSYLHFAGAGNVLVQRMVAAEYSGVLFTRDPSMGGLSMVEMVEGTAENLVSGMVRPQTYRFGRITKKPFGRESAPIDLAPLLALGDAAERLFGRAQDIEWTYRDGRVPPGAKPRHHPAGGRRRGHGLHAERSRPHRRPQQGRRARRGGVRQERDVRNAAAADRAVAVRSWRRCGRAAAASISPRASSA